MIEPRWIEIASAEAWAGVREVPGAGNSPQVLVYHQATTLRATEDAVPWCAAFVGYCLRLGGFRGTGSAAARSYLRWGQAIDPAPFGAVVVMSRGASSPPASVIDAPGHVGFLVGQPRPDEVLVLGGNQDDAVNVRAYPTSRVLGYRWPTNADRLLPVQGGE